MAARTIFLIFCYFLFFKNDAASTQSTVIPITKDTGEKAAASTLSTVIPITKDTGEKAAASTLSTVIPITKDTGEKAAASTQSTVIHTTNNTGATSRSTDHVNTTTDGVISLSTAATLISSTQNPSLSNDTQGNTNLNATSAPNYNTTVIVIGNTNSNATSAPSHNKTVTENTKLNATSAPNGNKTGPENTGNKADSEQHERGTKDKEADHKWVWIVLGLSAVAIIVAGAYWKCYKAQNHPVETMDHGTENASFQRTESNKDGVMLLGVKTGGEENAAAK
ncbi:uncharacterized protein LOC124387661 isoform X6 [Silurus meridionalis]|uniref:uncharacterized protein LOC124387661 isoform X6 n=1 Tax=Silurus meridionalis TaxID=175797 RepID=UPI001EEC2B33|nr:uncharacterized protein LOC124387661 isoform X6 [Silurus meridionalis]